MAIALALGTSVFYGVANYLGPLVSRRLPIAWFMLVSQGAALVVLAALVLVAGGAPPDSNALAWGLGAGALNAVALGAFYRATNLGPISVVVPIGALGAIVPVLAGLLDGERPSALQGIGIPLAIGGVMLAASGGDRRSDDHELRATARAVIVWSLLAAGLFGLFLTAFAQASDDGPLWATLDTRISMVGVVLVAVLATRAATPLAPREVPAVALPGLLLVLGTLMFAEATTRGLLSVVSVIATLFPVVTVTLAMLLLRERLDGRQAVGITLALAAVVAIAAG